MTDFSKSRGGIMDSSEVFARIQQNRNAYRLWSDIIAGKRVFHMTDQPYGWGTLVRLGVVARGCQDVSRARITDFGSIVARNSGE